MRFDAIQHYDGEDRSTATITLTGTEIRVIAQALGEADVKSSLRSQWYLLFELVINGYVDAETFRICSKRYKEANNVLID